MHDVGASASVGGVNEGILTWDLQLEFALAAWSGIWGSIDLLGDGLTHTSRRLAANVDHEGTSCQVTNCSQW